MSDPTPIHETFREARKKARLSQAEVSRRLNNYGLEVSPSTVTKWEAGERSISMEAAMRLCDVLGVEWGTLYKAPETSPGPEELITEALQIIDRRHFNLIDVANREPSAAVETAVKYLTQSEATSRVASDFLAFAPQLIAMLEKADEHTREASRRYYAAQRELMNILLEAQKADGSA